MEITSKDFLNILQESIIDTKFRIINWGIVGGNERINWDEYDVGFFRIKIRSFDAISISKMAKIIVEKMSNIDYGIFEEEIDKNNHRKYHIIIFAPISHIEKLKKDQEQKGISPSIGTQINAPVTVNRDFISGDGNEVSTTSNNNEDKNWFSKEVIKTVLTIIGTIIATLIIQILLKKFGISI